MAKGYWIGRVEVNNEDGYKPYAAANPAIAPTTESRDGITRVPGGSLSARARFSRPEP